MLYSNNANFLFYSPTLLVTKIGNSPTRRTASFFYTCVTAPVAGRCTSIAACTCMATPTGRTDLRTGYQNRLILSVTQYFKAIVGLLMNKAYAQVD